MIILQIPDSKFNGIVADLSEKAIREFFTDKTFITGEEIVNFFPHKQVNHFILFQIYQDWNAFSARITHPYFDFKNEEVRSSIQRLQNLLSSHIRIEKADFKPLLDKALYNSIKLILNPVDTFCSFFFMNRESLPIALFEKYSSYFADFDFIIASILAYHQKNEMPAIEKRVFLEKVQRVVELFEEKQGRKIGDYRSDLFRAISGQELRDLAMTNTALDRAFLANLSELDTPARPNVMQTGVGLPVGEELQNNPYFQNTESVKQKNKNPLLSAIDVEPATRVSDQYTANPSKIHESIGKKGLTIEQIPLHKQFQFIQKLFEGSNNRFKAFVETLSTCTTLEAAEKNLQEELLSKPGLDEKALQEFVTLVRNKY